MRQQTRDVTSGERRTDGVAGRISVRYERITVSALPPADPPRSADLPSLRGWHAGCSHRVRHTRPAARLETPGRAAVGPEGDAMANKTLFQSIVGKLLPRPDAANEAGGRAYQCRHGGRGPPPVHHRRARTAAGP
jgi:hypothetical protein